jgi:hypothetical protein
MAWILGIIILVVLLAFCVYQLRESQSDADRYDLSRRD